MVWNIPDYDRESMLESVRELFLCYAAQAGPNLSSLSHLARIYTKAERGNSSSASNRLRMSTYHSSVLVGRPSDPSLYRESCKRERRPQFVAPTSFLCLWAVFERIVGPILPRFCGSLAGARSAGGPYLSFREKQALEIGARSYLQRQMSHRSYCMP